MFDKLLKRLNRVFDKNPHAFLAFTIIYSGTDASWKIEDNILTLTTVAAVPVVNRIDLSSYTIAGLVNYITALPGYRVQGITNFYPNLSAMVLIDGGDFINNPTAAGGRMYGFTNPLFGWIGAYAAELNLAKTAISQMPAEMSTATADSTWLDLLGTYYAIPRFQNPTEPDGQYGLRIIAQTIAPKGNNKAIEAAIASYSGQKVTVNDVVIYQGASITHDGEINHDGTHTHSGGTAKAVYGLFDVVVGYNVVTGGTVATFEAQVLQVIEQMRDAGTQLRALSLVGSQISDAVRKPSDQGGTMTLTVTYHHDGLIVRDGTKKHGTSTRSGTMISLV